MARFGVRLENDPNLSPQDYQELASQAEKNGFEAVWVPEGGGRDSLTSLATIAMKTNTVKLGTGILPVFARQHRHGRGRDGGGLRWTVPVGSGSWARSHCREP